MVSTAARDSRAGTCGLWMWDPAGRTAGTNDPAGVAEAVLVSAR
jgi:hypothetical protein